MTKKIFVRKRFQGHSHYSGYDCLYNYLNNNFDDSINIVHSHKKIFWFPNAIYNSLKRNYRVGTLFYNSSASVVTELKAFWAAYKSKAELIHFGYFEDHYGLFRSARVHKNLTASKIIATIHCPVSWWKLYGNPNQVKGLDGLIVLSTSDVPFFQKYLPGKVHCIPHGIDTDFFTPASDKKNTAKFRCIFVGQWLRDIETMVCVVEKLLAQRNDIIFDIFYPQWKMHNKDFLYRIVNHPNVMFHNHVTDDVLRKHYQNADILLLPLFDCTANNAVLEGMACGLPIVSNDVPGIHTYVNDSFSILKPVADVDGMVNAVLQYRDDSELLQKHSIQAREYAVQNFTWENIANQVTETYSKILENGK